MGMVPQGMLRADGLSSIWPGCFSRMVMGSRFQTPVYLKTSVLWTKQNRISITYLI